MSRPAAALVVALAALATPSSAVQGAPGQGRPPAAAPTLVVVLVVDQMRGDYLDRFSHDYHDGLRRLGRESAVFTRAYQDHGVTETAPGHSTILTGRDPASTGIVRNSDGVVDSVSALIGTTGPGASPERLRGTTLFDWMRAANPATRVLSLSRKDRSAILLVGRAQAPVFWYSEGRFTTSRYYGDSLPDWIRAFNDELAAWHAPVWNLLEAPSHYPEPDSVPWERGGRDVAFPHPVSWPYGSAGIPLVDTPYMDSLTLALALRGVQTLGLGTGPGTDLLTIGLSSGDGVGHAWGPDSREIHDQYLRLDRWLGAFMDSLRALRGAEGLAVVVTADHGISAYPEWSRLRGLREARHVVVDTVLRGWQMKLEDLAGPGNWILYRAYGLVTINRAGLAAKGFDPDSIADLMAADFRRVPGVARVDTRRTLAHADTVRDVVARRWVHALPDSLPVGVLIALREGNVFGPYNGAARHGQNTENDSHVVLAFWGSPFRPGRYNQRVSTVDIAPTLARVLGIEPLEPVTGRVLTEALNDGRR